MGFEPLTAVRNSVRTRGEDFFDGHEFGNLRRDYAPLGLHVERGKELHALNRSCASGGNFFKCPNGVFLLTDKGAQVLYTTEYTKFKGKVFEAAQSGPILLRQGKIHPAFHQNSGN